MENKLSQYPLLNLFKMKRFGQNSSRSSLTTSNQIDDEDPRRFSLSHKYYTENAPPTPKIPGPNHLPYTKQYSTKQSQRLPPWIVALVSHSLGVHPVMSPAFGTIIHVIMFTAALMYIVTFFWVRTYDIMSPNTPTEILQGTVTILIALIWAALGMYSKSLAKRLFRHPRFIRDVRMHSRTIFKINAALLSFLLGLIFVITNDVETTLYLKSNTCQLIELPVFVCWMYFVSKVLFSTFSLLWNTLIAIILISICRTHTIGLRRFIRELEEDALQCDNMNCMQYREHPMTKEDVFEETFWLEEEQKLDDEDFVFVNHKINLKRRLQVPPDGAICEPQNDSPSHQDLLPQNTVQTTNAPSPKRKAYVSFNDHVSNGESDNFVGINVIPVHDEMHQISDITMGGAGSSDSGHGSDNQDAYKSETDPSCSSAGEAEYQRFPEGIPESNRTPFKEVKPMSSEEILHKYWKISCRLRASSCIFQRWLASLMSLVIIWSIIYLLYWQYQPASMSDVIQFVIPLVLLPLLCSAFAEVNLEGVRMVKCIFPINDRLALLRFLQMNPLQMTLFNVNLSYSTILTVVFAIFVAFTSRLIFTELQKS